MKRAVALMVLPILIFLTACGGAVTPPPPSETVPPSRGPEIVIKGLAFLPEDLTITGGTSVTWINEDPITHSVVGEGFESPQLNQGDSWSHTFDTPGTFDYHCGIHPSMQGQVVVQ